MRPTPWGQCEGRLFCPPGDRDRPKNSSAESDSVSLSSVETLTRVLTTHARPFRRDGTPTPLRLTRLETTYYKPRCSSRVPPPPPPRASLRVGASRRGIA